MCLAVIAVDALRDWPLIIVANRDEFHERPTAALAQWQDRPQILAGRDLRASGTWLGVNQRGSLALLTNVREPGQNNPDAISRGQLVENYLSSNLSAQQYQQSIQSEINRFNGFNLILCDETQALFMSNRGGNAGVKQDSIPLTAGVFGVSNASLDTPWPKVVRTREAIRQVLKMQGKPSVETMFQIFSDQASAPEQDLPQTGLPLDRERLLSRPFIVDPIYGTRSTAIVLKHHSGLIQFLERSYAPSGQVIQQQNWTVDTLHEAIQYNP